MIDYIVTFTDNHLKNIAKGLLSYNGIEASDLRKLKTTKTKVVETIVADPEFKQSLLLMIICLLAIFMIVFRLKMLWTILLSSKIFVTHLKLRTKKLTGSV